MVSVWEHIHRLNGHHLILGIEQLEVACLSSRVTAHIHNAFRLGKENDINHIVVHTGTWRGGDDDIRTTMSPA